jgi:hypothetical protein
MFAENIENRASWQKRNFGQLEEEGFKIEISLTTLLQKRGRYFLEGTGFFIIRQSKSKHVCIVTACR